MKLALKYILYYRTRTCVFVAILSLILVTPFINRELTASLVDKITDRTKSSPVIITGKAGEIKETLSSLFFVQGLSEEDFLKYKYYQETTLSDGEAAPLFIKFRSKFGPVVGTEIDYFSFRDISVAKGNQFSIPGDVVVGHDLARDHNIKLDDKIVVQVKDPYDISKSSPIELVVTGILEDSGSPDDSVLFTSLQTVWILEGLLHSHIDATPVKPNQDGEVVYPKGMKTSQKISFENIYEFHFHEEEEDLPITHIIFRGATHKSEVLLMNAINDNIELMAFRPDKPMNEIIKLFIRLEDFFAKYHLFWSICTLAMFGLIFSLLIQNRKVEFSVLISLGASRHFLFINIAQLILIYLTLASIFAAGFYYLSIWLIQEYLV